MAPLIHFKHPNAGMWGGQVGMFGTQHEAQCWQGMRGWC